MIEGERDMTLTIIIIVAVAILIKIIYEKWNRNRVKNNWCGWGR